jgi:4a-hydroxytetrahydrobiopterin dehydratase
MSALPPPAPRPVRLDGREIARGLRELPGWAVPAGKLHRELTFPGFIDAFAFMTAAALTAEAMPHHPEWCNVWNRVTVDLVTGSPRSTSTWPRPWSAWPRAPGQHEGRP